MITEKFLIGYMVGTLIGLMIPFLVLWISGLLTKWRSWRIRRKYSKAILEELQRNYGSQKFSKGWQEQEWKL